MDEQTSFNKILNSFKIKASCVSYEKIDNYFFFDLRLAPSTKVKDIIKYSDELSLALRTPCKPIVKILHKTGVVRLEFVSYGIESLNLFDYIKNLSKPFGEAVCCLGKTVDGNPVWMDLLNNPHMLVAGTTGSGKSTLLNNIIGNLLYFNQCKIFLADPKNIEFSEYEKIDKCEVTYTYDSTLEVLKTLVGIMELRYKMLRSGTSINSFLPLILIIDEFADLIMQDNHNEFYECLCRLAQKCRAAKIHIILATQRPTVNIINGTIKANFPARISCRVASHVDSKVILDCSGAENLIGNGDALLKDGLRSLERFQIAYTSAKEICSKF